MQWGRGTTGQDREVAAQPVCLRCRGQPDPQSGRPAGAFKRGYRGWLSTSRARIDEEDRGLSWEEKRRKTHLIVMQDPLLASLGKKVVSPESLHPLANKEP